MSRNRIDSSGCHEYEGHGPMDSNFSHSLAEHHRQRITAPSKAVDHKEAEARTTGQTPDSKNALTARG